MGRPAGRGIQRAAGRSLQRRAGRQNLWLSIFDLQIRDFLLDLGLELVRSPPELVHPFAGLSRDPRQLLRPKDDKGQQEQEDRFGKTHALHHTAGEGTAAMRRAHRI